MAFWACDPHSHCQAIQLRGLLLPGHTVILCSVQVSIDLVFCDCCLRSWQSKLCLHCVKQRIQQLSTLTCGTCLSNGSSPLDATTRCMKTHSCHRPQQLSVLTPQPRALQARGRMHYSTCTDHHVTSVDLCSCPCPDVLARLMLALRCTLGYQQQKKKVWAEVAKTSQLHNWHSQMLRGK